MPNRSQTPASREHCFFRSHARFRPPAVASAEQCPAFRIEHVRLSGQLEKEQDRQQAEGEGPGGAQRQPITQ
jgi:hypothetical protein